jgi:uncharacterized membrane protein (DUF4010 family)
MVVLIVGISLCAYLAQRFLGVDTGIVAAGALGGLISSTATTVSYARRSRSSPQDVPATALVLALSSTVVLPRVLLLVALVAPGQIVQLAPPLVAMLGVMGVVCVVTYLRTHDALGRARLDHAPSDLRAAVAFGALYSAVLLGIAAARHWLGAGGLYAVATLSGLTDVDAITLSTARMLEAGRIDGAIGWRLILIGVMANMAFKGAAALGLGHPALRGWIAGIFGSALVLGGGLLWCWPGA